MQVFDDRFQAESGWTGAKVLRIKEVFHSEMERGIHQEPSSLQMENTYIPELPDGTGE
jgi:hexokinase